MRKIRVLVVDDSAVARSVLSRALGGDPEVEVVGVAATGSIALSKIAQLAPDLVTLDVVMPDMDGLEILRAIKTRHPTLPVIMVSSLTDHGAKETVEALSLGAADYTLKPSTRDLDASIAALQADLVDKVKAICGAHGSPVADSADSCEGSAAVLAAPVLAEPGLGTAVQPAVVVVGVSTGGPQALAQELPKLPANFPAPVLVVQHMPPSFTRRLAERLDGACPLVVREAEAGAAIGPGTIWIAPGDWHLAVAGTSDRALIALTREAAENSCRPSADVLFRSAATVYGDLVLGVVLTGMGQDGLRGAQAIVGAGGRVWVQDPTSSVVWGMPGSVARAGLAERVVLLERLSADLCERVGMPSE